MRIFLSRNSSTVGLWLSCRVEESEEKDIRTLLFPYRVLLGDLFYCSCRYGNKSVRTFPVLCFYLPFIELVPGKCPFVMTPWILSHLAARAAHCSLGSWCGCWFPAEADHPWQKWEARQESLLVWCPRKRQRPQHNSKMTCTFQPSAAVACTFALPERSQAKAWSGSCSELHAKGENQLSLPFWYSADLSLPPEKAGRMISAIELLTVSIDTFVSQHISLLEVYVACYKSKEMAMEDCITSGKHLHCFKHFC